MLTLVLIGASAFVSGPQEVPGFKSGIQSFAINSIVVLAILGEMIRFL